MFRFNEERKFALLKALGVTFKEGNLSGWTYDRGDIKQLKRRNRSIYRTCITKLDAEMQIKWQI